MLQEWKNSKQRKPTLHQQSLGRWHHQRLSRAQAEGWPVYQSGQKSKLHWKLQPLKRVCLRVNSNFKLCLFCSRFIINFILITGTASAKRTRNMCRPRPTAMSEAPACGLSSPTAVVVPGLIHCENTVTPGAGTIQVADDVNHTLSLRKSGLFFEIKFKYWILIYRWFISFRDGICQRSSFTITIWHHGCYSSVAANCCLIEHGFLPAKYYLLRVQHRFLPTNSRCLLTKHGFLYDGWSRSR